MKRIADVIALANTCLCTKDADLFWRDFVTVLISQPPLKSMSQNFIRIIFQGRKEYWFSVELIRNYGVFETRLFFNLTPGRLGVSIDTFRAAKANLAKPKLEPLGLSISYECRKDEDLCKDLIPKVSKQINLHIQNNLETNFGLAPGIAASVAKCIGN
jgi:hypothetical protein